MAGEVYTDVACGAGVAGGEKEGGGRKGENGVSALLFFCFRRGMLVGSYGSDCVYRVGKSKRKKRHENGLRKLKGVSVRRLGDWERSGNVLWASEIVENMARKLQGMGLREVNTVLDMIGVKRVSSVDIGKVKAMDEGFGLCFVKRNVEESIHEEGEEE